MPDLNLDEIEKRCEAPTVFGHRANRAIMDARTDIPALVAEVKRLREERDAFKRDRDVISENRLRMSFAYEEKLKKRDEATDNVLEEAAKIAEAHMEQAEGVDTRVMHRNGTASAIARQIRALKTNKGE